MARAPLILFCVVLVAPLLLAGCAGSAPFQFAAPTWSPGHTWEFRVERTQSVGAQGDLPDFLEGEIEEDDDRCTDTHRIEVFNTTVRDAEQELYYATGRLVSPGGDGDRSCSGFQGWE